MTTKYVHIPNGHKRHKKIPGLNTSKIYQELGFWYENLPSGNPVSLQCFSMNVDSA
jgi:hypothetical protein